MYDWANSAYAVTILAALFGPYLSRVVVPVGGVDIPLFGMRSVSATSLFGYSLGFSALVVFVTAPFLGAIADRTSSKKAFLTFFVSIGSLATTAMFFVGPGDVGLAMALFILSNLCFIGGNVFYDAFLPIIASNEEMDDVSGRGYAYGYAGGGLMFLLALIVVQFHDVFGIADVTLAMRIALAGAGLWWGGFAIITLKFLSEPRMEGRVLIGELLRDATRRVTGIFRELKYSKHLALFLIAFMIYNDGIQTVISMGTMYGSDELGFDTMTMLGCLLMIQAVGILGSRFFAGLARRIGAKGSLVTTLAIWIGVTVFGFFMTNPVEFWVLGGLIGLVLGGSQALSRSIYGKMIPVEATAEFYGFFSIFEKFSAIGGPVLFALIRQITGSSRYSILALVFFFIAGMILLLLLDVRKALEDKKRIGQELLVRH
jgi:UMF1 family MFS transporter